MLRVVALLLVAMTGSPALAAAPQDDALRFGAIATLAPLCGLRDDAWARDLRGAELQAMAPGMARNEAVAVLSYAEDEAAEEFAEADPVKTCGPLGNDTDLRRADDVVAAFRVRGRV